MPRRVVVVSRNPGLGFGLESSGWEVVELRDRELEQLADTRAAGDALVLDLRDPARASSTVADLRSRGITTPVLLVAGGSPGWASVAAAQLSSTHILELPASRERLQSALDRLVGLADTSLTTPHSAPASRSGGLEQASEAPVRKAGRHVALPAPSVAPEQEAEPTARTVEAPHHDLPTQPAEGSAPLAVPADAVAPGGPSLETTVGTTGIETDDGQLDPPDVADAALARALAGRHVSAPPVVTRPRGFPPRPAAPAPAANTVETVPSAPALPGEVSGLVEALAGRLDELYSVPETGRVVAEQALETVAADAAAVFVPDDGVWRVAGDVGLRPLERRVALSRDAWLVDVVALSHRGVVVEDSDIARSRLGGVPLAHHAHLLAVPVPAIDGLVLLARSEEPAFTENDVAALAALSREAGALLRAAVQARSLARALSHLVDRPDAGR